MDLITLNALDRANEACTRVEALGDVLNFKGTKTSTSALPLSGNKKGDVWAVSGDNSEYVWTLDSTSGSISNWELLGKTYTQVSANPSLVGTESVLTGIEVDGTKYMVEAGISQSAADDRYLQKSGGTVTGPINFSTTSCITFFSTLPIIDANSGYLDIGNQNMSTRIHVPEYTEVYTARGSNNYTVLDGFNTSANPTLSGGETTLSALKLNGTNYAIPSGGGTTVSANPTLVGTESDLTGLQVGDTKYKIPSGGGGGSVAAIVVTPAYLAMCKLGNTFPVSFCPVESSFTLTIDVDAIVKQLARFADYDKSNAVWAVWESVDGDSGCRLMYEYDSETDSWSTSDSTVLEFDPFDVWTSMWPLVITMCEGNDPGCAISGYQYIMMDVPSLLQYVQIDYE